MPSFAHSRGRPGTTSEYAMPIRHAGEDGHRERRHRETDPVTDDRDPVWTRTLRDEVDHRAEDAQDGQVDQERRQVPPALEDDQRRDQPPPEDRHRPRRAEGAEDAHDRGEPVGPQGGDRPEDRGLEHASRPCGCPSGESQTSATARSAARASQTFPLRPSFLGSGGGAPVGRRRRPPTRAVPGRTPLVGGAPGALTCNCHPAGGGMPTLVLLRTAATPAAPTRRLGGLICQRITTTPVSSARSRPDRLSRRHGAAMLSPPRRLRAELGAAAVPGDTGPGRVWCQRPAHWWRRQHSSRAVRTPVAAWPSRSPASTAVMARRRSNPCRRTGRRARSRAGRATMPWSGATANAAERLRPLRPGRCCR